VQVPKSPKGEASGEVKGGQGPKAWKPSQGFHRRRSRRRSRPLPGGASAREGMETLSGFP
jgi:hypothetical protein